MEPSISKRLGDALAASFSAQDDQAVVKAGADGLAGDSDSQGVHHIAHLASRAFGQGVNGLLEGRQVEGIGGGEQLDRVPEEVRELRLS